MRKLIKLEGLSREDWLAIRRTGIGGSDVSAIMGLNKYKSALELYLDKKGLLPDSDEENLAAELGLELEDFLSKKFIYRYCKDNDIDEDKIEKFNDTDYAIDEDGLDITFLKPDCIYQYEDVGYFLVNFDRLITEKVGKKILAIPVELKTTTEFNRDDWKDDEVPDSYYLQVQWQIYISDAPHAYIAYLIGNRTFDYKKIPRNQKVIDNLIKQAKIFWNDYYLKGIPPAPDGSLSAKDALNIIYADDKNDDILDLTKDLKDDYVLYKDLTADMKITKIELDQVKQKFMALMGNNTFATVDILDTETGEIKTRKIRYRNIDRAGYTVEPKTFKQFNIY